MSKSPVNGKITVSDEEKYVVITSPGVGYEYTMYEAEMAVMQPMMDIWPDD